MQNVGTSLSPLTSTAHRTAQPSKYYFGPPTILDDAPAACPSRCHVVRYAPRSSTHAKMLFTVPICAPESTVLSPHFECQGGGIAPPVQRGAAHPRTNPAARAAGGEPPPLKALRALRAPRKCRSSSGPGGHTPLSQPHRCGTVLDIRRSMSCCLGPASGPALVPDALPARAHTPTH